VLDEWKRVEKARSGLKKPELNCIRRLPNKLLNLLTARSLRSFEPKNSHGFLSLVYPQIGGFTISGKSGRRQKGSAQTKSGFSAWHTYFPCKPVDQVYVKLHPSGLCVNCGRSRRASQPTHSRTQAVRVDVGVAKLVSLRREHENPEQLFRLIESGFYKEAFPKRGFI